MSKRPRKPEDLGLRESDFSDFSGDDESNRPDTVGNETNRSDINGDDGNDEASSDSELEILEVNPVVPDKRRRSSPAGPAKRRMVGTFRLDQPTPPSSMRQQFNSETESQPTPNPAPEAIPTPAATEPGPEPEPETMPTPTITEPSPAPVTPMPSARPSSVPLETPAESAPVSTPSVPTESAPPVPSPTPSSPSPMPMPEAEPEAEPVTEPVAEFSQTADIYGFLEKYGVAVCKECLLGVPPRKIRGHLNLHSSDSEYKDRIASVVNSWDLKRSQDAIPKGPVPWIRALGMPKDGLRCTYDNACGYVCSKLSTMKKHWSHKHGFSISTQGPQTRQQRRANREREKPMRQVPIQRFFNCECKSWFEVETEQEIVTESEVRRRFREMIEEGCDIDRRIREENRVAMARITQKDANQFMEEMAFQPYLTNFNSIDLATLFEKPSGLNLSGNTLVMLERVWNAMDSLSKIAEDCLRDPGMWQICYDVMRVEESEAPSKPLIPYMEDATRKSQVKAWQEVVMFFLRTRPGRSKRWPLYDLTRRQTIARNRIVEILQDPDCESDSDPDETEEIEDAEEQGIAIVTVPENDSRQHINTAIDQTAVKVPKLERALLEFCCSLMDDKYTRREIECALRIAMAVTGASAGGGYLSSAQYTRKLSGLIKIGRTMLVLKAILVDQENPDGPGATEVLCEMVDRFMLRSRHSPMASLRHLMVKGMGQQRRETADAKLWWEDDGQTVVINGQRLGMIQFKEMVHRINRKAHEQLAKLLYRHSCHELPKIPWDDLHDNASNVTVDWNFLKDHRTESVLKKKLGQSPVRWILGNLTEQQTTELYTPGAMTQYIGQVEAFLATMLVLVHLSGGQPPRSTELLTIGHANGHGLSRGVYIMEGMVAMVTQYNKSVNRTQRAPKVFRYLPREVGELIVWYMWLVLPFESSLRVRLSQEDEKFASDTRNLFWPYVDAENKHAIWDGDKVGREVKKQFRDHTGQAIGIGYYRHIAIGIAREFLRIKDDLDAIDEADNEEVQEMQAGHTTAVGENIYGRLNSDAPGSSARMQRAFQRFSVGWHKFCSHRE
uniref:ARAD1D00132p n=1 Tax=Blastobotrys adeninivorans TaxID=409370 RepID=A0A060TDG4_BLAAD